MKPPRRPRYGQNDDLEIHAGGEEDPDFPEQMPDHGRPRRRRGSRLIPLLIFAGFGLFVLKEQVPAVNDAFQSLLRPAAFRAIEACREAALAGSPNPDFARLLRRGRASETRGGFFVDDVVVGELERGKGEVRREVECHVDRDGKGVEVTRRDAGAPPAPRPQFTGPGRHASD